MSGDGVRETEVERRLRRIEERVNRIPTEKCDGGIGGFTYGIGLMLAVGYLEEVIREVVK
jgi:hypothetical protein